MSILIFKKESVMKVLLSVPERILLGSSCLPSENDFVTLKVVRAIKKTIGFSEEELKEFEIKSIPVEQGRTRFEWNTAKEKSVEFEFSDKQTDLVIDSLDILAKNKRATEAHLELYEKFTSQKQGSEVA
jgi:hypothetical protein